MYYEVAPPVLTTFLCLVSLPGILLLPETNNEALEDAYHQSRDTPCHETQDMNNIETDLNGAQTTTC